MNDNAPVSGLPDGGIAPSVVEPESIEPVSTPEQTDDIPTLEEFKAAKAAIFRELDRYSEEGFKFKRPHGRMGLAKLKIKAKEIREEYAKWAAAKDSKPQKSQEPKPAPAKPSEPSKPVKARSQPPPPEENKPTFIHLCFYAGMPMIASALAQFLDEPEMRAAGHLINREQDYFNPILDEIAKDYDIKGFDIPKEVKLAMGVGLIFSECYLRTLEDQADPKVMASRAGAHQVSSLLKLNLALSEQEKKKFQ